MKRLLVMRHGKSDWDADYDFDHDRPLNSRGRRSARAMGAVLARSGLIPELAITSSAVRARSTLELAVESGAWDTVIRVDGDLYGTSSDRALAIAAAVPDHVASVMLVGHQPTWGDLVYRLSGAWVQVKTATVVGIDLPIPAWRHLASATGELVFVLQPRMFTSASWDLA